MRSKHFPIIYLALLLLLAGVALSAQRSPAVGSRPARQSPARPARPTRPDNYPELRARYVERLEREKAVRERRTLYRGVRYEDLFEVEFQRWDWYWGRHLTGGPTDEPGKMADMSLALRQYYEAAQREGKTTGRDGKVTLPTQGTPPVCPSAGFGNWTSMGPSTYAAPVIGKVTSVYISPNNPNTVYAGSAEGGLFKTVNNGGFWQSLTDPHKYPALGITSIAVHPNIPTTLYISTNNGTPGGRYGFGILKSLDGGTTWNEIFKLAPFDNQANYGIGEGSFVSKVMLHPQDPNTVYAVGSHYAFRSVDAGQTWAKVLEIPLPNPNPEGCKYRLLDIDIINGTSGVADSNVIISSVRTAYMGYANSPCGTAKTFISTTGGSANSFNEITSAVLGTDLTDRIAAAAQPGNGSEFFFGYQNLNTGQFVLKKYNIAGNTATLVGTINANGVFQLGAGFWNIELEFSKLNPDTLYVAGTTAYRISLASGFSSAQISTYWATDPNTCAAIGQTHGDTRAVMVSTNGANDILVLGSDGGIHKAQLNPSTPYTTTTAPWDDISGPGLAINEFYDVNGLESNPDLLVGGTQDNGTFKYNNGVWAQAFNYDGYQGTLNQATGQYYGLTNGGPITGMAGTAGIFNFASGPNIFKGPVVSDPNNPATIYAGAGASLQRSLDFGVTWTALPPPPGTKTVSVIHVAPSDSNVIYVARGDLPSYNQSDISKRLLRSDDGGNTWTDLGTAPGANLGALAWISVSDIAVDPDDARRVWVSFDGYWPTSNTTIAGVARVYYSADGGVTWTDFTYNLLAFPVASLVYRRGSNDELYAANDVGVFRYDKPSQSWQCFSNQLPVVPVTRLEFNYCKGKIRCATYGRGIYESDLAALPGEVVNTSTTWSGVRYLSNDLTIAPGATLTITGTLNMSKGAIISVQRGATLKVNGGKLTNCCGDMWQGIEVWGTPTVAQNLAAAQGKVILQNGARIENAEEAITTGRTINGSFVSGYEGGIVQATNSTFSNNRRSAGFLPYHWMYGATEVNNASYFKNCTFETTRLLNEPTLMPYAHISLHEVKNVAFSGCKFKNTAPAGVFGPNQRGGGLISIDAQYTVDDLFQTFIWPPVVAAPSYFEGLTYGVRADFAAGANARVIVQNSDFQDVRRGVEVNNSNGSLVIGNNFNALPNGLAIGFANATWGVRMNGASVLSVSGNTVTGANPSYLEDYGVIIDHCGASPSNIVKGNTFKNLDHGIAVLGNNGAGTSGVQFRCNVFQAIMAYQLYIHPTATLASQGSACVQGSTADNTFFAQALPPGSQISSLGPVFDYFASGTVPFNVAGGVTVNSCGGVSGECSSGLSGTGSVNYQEAPDLGVYGLVFAVMKVGTIHVNLPDDMAAGDTLTGTVVVEPEGRGALRDENLRALSRYLVEVDGRKVPAGENRFRLTLPQAPQVTLLTVRLLDAQGRVLESQDVPYLRRPPQAPKDVSLPSYGRAGRSLAIACPCDGVVADGDFVKVGGAEMLTLAESPRQRIVLDTSEATGQTQLEFVERGRASKGALRNIRLNVTASKSTLKRGERATLRIEVRGLERLAEEVPLFIENRTPNIVTVGGGDQQAFTIRPSDVRPGGIYRTERVLTGINGNAFLVDVRIQRASTFASERYDFSPGQNWSWEAQFNSVLSDRSASQMLSNRGLTPSWR